jgi:L-ascorbate metabolism protein UlaG (beta-lactamase superfamily)
MRLTKYGHACVRIEDDGRVLVVDPGVYSEPEALSGASAVLVTHEHEDHVDLDQLERAVLADRTLTVHGPKAWAESARDRLGAQVVGVTTSEQFSAGGFDIIAVGGKHAEIIDGLPDCANLGYVVDGIYHPGDSYFVPAEPVETLLVPANGPWTKHREAIEFVRAVRPSRMFPIHDIGLSALGCSNFDAWMGDEVTDYARISAGSSVTF